MVQAKLGIALYPWIALQPFLSFSYGVSAWYWHENVAFFRETQRLPRSSQYYGVYWIWGGCHREGGVELSKDAEIRRTAYHGSMQTRSNTASSIHTRGGDEAIGMHLELSTGRFSSNSRLTRAGLIGKITQQRQLHTRFCYAIRRVQDAS